MSSIVERATSVALAVAALVAATVLVHREFSSQGIASTADHKPVFVDHWQNLASSGTWLGRPDAPVVLIEFSDFECPFCRRFDQNYRSLPKSVRDQAAILFIHYPLTNHRFALPAARAAECAGEQGAFVRFHDALYDKQDSLGLKSWQSFAVDAGLRDTVAFDRCVASGRTSSSITHGLALGDSLKLTGTPTLIVNGWRISRIAYDSLEALIGTYAPKAGPGPKSN